MSNREAAAAITAEREALIDLAHRLSYFAYSWGFEAGKVGQHVDTTIAGNKAATALNTLIARLSAPVAAQPAASGVDAAMELADEYAIKHALHVQGRASMTAAVDAREALRAHLS